METQKDKAVAAEAIRGHLQKGAAAPASLRIRAFKLALRFVFKLFFRVRVQGLENVPRTPVIICANHLGWADVFLVLVFLPAEPRIYVLGEQQVKYISGFRTRVIDWLQIMVMLDRSKPLEALRIMRDVLQRGGSLLIFPEGKLGTEEGALQELQDGAAHLSVVSGVPLLPVGLTGTSELWLRRKLTLRASKPINPDKFEGNTRTRMRAMTERLDKEMRALVPGDNDRGPRVKLLGRWLTKLF